MKIHLTNEHSWQSLKYNVTSFIKRERIGEGRTRWGKCISPFSFPFVLNDVTKQFWLFLIDSKTILSVCRSVMNVYFLVLIYFLTLVYKRFYLFISPSNLFREIGKEKLAQYYNRSASTPRPLEGRSWFQSFLINLLFKTVE